MTTIGAYKAKTHFSQLIERVSKGERIIITRHNVPIAMMQPVAPKYAASPEEVIAQIKDFRQKYRLGGLSVQEMKEEGRA